MRISDWSSDVCSSDLSQHHDSLTQAETLPWSDMGTFARAAAFANQYDGRAAFQREDLFLRNRRQSTHQQADLFDIPLMHAAPPPSRRRARVQIGRAS